MFAYVRLCSLMFAYARLMGKKMLRALRAAWGLQNVRNDEKAKPVHSDRQSGQIRPNPTKSDQIKLGQRYQTRDGSCRRDADSGGWDARAPRRMGASRSRPIRVDQ